MQLSLAEAKHILEAKKELFNPHPWSPVNNRAGSTPLSFSARVRLDGGAYRGLWFRASTFAHNRHVSTQHRTTGREVASAALPTGLATF